MRETKETRSESAAHLSRQQRRAGERASRKTAGFLTSGAAFATLAGMAGGQPAAAATFQVDNLNDAGAGSLRQAIIDANTAAGADVITFQAGLTGTITLTSGQLYIQDSVDVQGPGAAVLTVSGNNSSRVFYLYRSDALIDVTISGLTITEGSAVTGAGIVDYGENLLLEDVVITANTALAGGGIAAVPGDPPEPLTLTIRNSTISGNLAAVGGGLAFNFNESPVPATMLIQGSVIADNYALYAGGGILVAAFDGEMTIETSTISGNEAGSTGGGLLAGFLYAGSTLAIRETTISGNTSGGSGGGLSLFYSQGSLVLENTTVSGNQATGVEGGYGGGLYLGYLNGETTIRHSTIAGNSATGIGGGLFTLYGTVAIENTIVGDNTADDDNDLCGGGTYEARFSLVEDPGAATINDNGGNVFNQDPQLGPLQNNGGPTETHKPAATSPAVGAGDPAFVPPPATDQRGLPREIPDGGLDMGAVELQMGTVQFSLASYSVNENGGTATITVTRTGGSDGAVSVDFATTDGTALQPGDYATAAGMLNWADGDSAPKSFQVTIVDDSGDELDETVNLTLTNVQGATIGSPGAAVLTILDDDQPLTIADIPTLGDAGKTLFAVLAAAAGYVTLRRRVRRAS